MNKLFVPNRPCAILDSMKQVIKLFPFLGVCVVYEWHINPFLRTVLELRLLSQKITCCEQMDSLGLGECLRLKLSIPAPL
jgi:hypothetical protein